MTMKKLAFFLFLLCTQGAYAQVKIGDNPTSINPNSVLELESTHKGLLLPRLGLSATDNFSPLAAHVAGMIVYNTATSGMGNTAVSPGFYYNDGTQWVPVTPGGSSNVVNIGGGQYVFINEAGDSTLIDVTGDVINNYQTILGDTAVAHYLDSLYGDMAINTTLAFDSVTSILTYSNEENNNPPLNLNVLKIEPWMVENTTEKATLNTQNIYQMGHVGIGVSDLLDNVSLDVRGPFRSGINHTGSVGVNSAAIGNGNTASGINSVAIGVNNIVSSGNGMAVGNRNEVAGDANFAFGFANRVTPSSMWGCTIFGYENNVEGGYANSIFGRSCTTTNSFRTLALGDLNVMDWCHETAVFGANNTISNTQNVFVAGYGHKLISGYSNDQCILGTGNAITNADALPVKPLLQVGRSIYANDKNALTIMKDATTAIGVDGPEAAAVPTELLDLGGNGTFGKSGLRIRNINSPTYAGDPSNDKMVVVDSNGILKALPFLQFPLLNLYNGNGTLNGNREVNTAGNLLRFANGSNFVDIFTPYGEGRVVVAGTSRGGVQVNAGASGSESQGNFFVDHNNTVQLDASGTATMLGIVTTSSQPIQFATNNIYRVAIDASGNMGLGELSPTNTLHVKATADPLRVEGLQTGDVTENFLTVDANGVVHNRTFSLPIKSVAADYALLTTDYKVLVRSVGLNNVEITLPDPASCPGRMYLIQNMNPDGGGVMFNYNIEIGLGTVITSGAPVLLGGAFVSGYLAGSTIMLQSDGAVWTGITQ